MLPRVLEAARVPTKAVRNPHGVCLLHPIRTERAASAATPFASLGKLLSSHRAITRTSLAALSITVIAALSHQPAVQAGPEPTPLTPESLLPSNVGIAVDTQAAITISFDTPMNPASVESAFELVPAQPVRLSWNGSRTELSVTPDGQWRNDENYLVVLGSEAATWEGTTLRAAERYSFTTATAPAVTDFQVHLAGANVVSAKAAEAEVKEVSVRSALATDTGDFAAVAITAQPIGAGATSKAPSSIATRVSATSSISIDFSVPMDRADVEKRFAISPKVDGTLAWKHGSLVFTPSERLSPGTRYTVSILGAHDVDGNPVGGESNFTFVVQSGAQVRKTDPAKDSTDVETGKLSMSFSQPMNRHATAAALRVVNTATGAAVSGKVTWDATSTRLAFTPSEPFAAGTTFSVALAKGARDADGNAVTANWSFSTSVAPVVVVAQPVAQPGARASAPSIPPAAPATSLAGYALNQVNAARAAYGFAPLVLDASISAAAASHAMDQAVNNYFSHTGRDGSSRDTRLARAGVSWDWWTGENQCYLVGRSQEATLNWCHQQFMAEPYPGYWNHINNILNPNARRMGVGIAQVGGKIVIVWDFAD